MKNALQPRTFNRINDSELTGSLQEILDRKYSDFVSAARKHWEKNCSRHDPSDSCVSVRISRSPALSNG
ncbi:MAG: hypothetical protein ACXWG0_02330 [Chthoniobacterales bacterium]